MVLNLSWTIYEYLHHLVIIVVLSNFPERWLNVHVNAFHFNHVLKDVTLTKVHDALNDQIICQVSQLSLLLLWMLKLLKYVSVFSAV